MKVVQEALARIEAMTPEELEEYEPQVTEVMDLVTREFGQIDSRRDEIAKRSIPIAPQDLPMLRAELIAELESTAPGRGREWLTNRMGFKRDEVEDKGAVAEAGTRIAAEQAAALHVAMLLFVSEPMARLLEHGHEGMGETGFERSDLPAESGMAYLDLDMPLSSGRDTDHGERLMFVWRTVAADATYLNGRCEVTCYVDRERLPLRGLVKDDERWRSMPRFLWDDATSIAFGPVARDVAHGQVNDRLYDTEVWWRARRGPMFRALCYLLSQRVTSSEQEEPTRTTRKLVKRGGGEPAPIRVVTLRGAQSATVGSASDREYVHQWMVRGHWRRHWYPSIKQHRPLFIAPYIKGPDGAPLLGGEKVYRATTSGGDA